MRTMQKYLIKQDFLAVLDKLLSEGGEVLVKRVLSFVKICEDRFSADFSWKIGSFKRAGYNLPVEPKLYYKKYINSVKRKNKLSTRTKILFEPLLLNQIEEPLKTEEIKRAKPIDFEDRLGDLMSFKPKLTKQKRSILTKKTIRMDSITGDISKKNQKIEEMKEKFKEIEEIKEKKLNEKTRFPLKKTLLCCKKENNLA